MRHRIKRLINSKPILGILSVCIITFIGGLLFIRSATFMDWVKQRVAAEIRNRIDAGYTVALGDMTGNLLTGVKIADVAVFQSGGTRDEAVLSLRELVLKYRLLGLLHRKFEVTALEISKPQVQAEVDATGTLNLTQLFSPSADIPRLRGSGSRWTVAVQRVRCSDGTLRFIDNQRNLSIAMAGLSVDIQGPLNTWNHRGRLSISDGSVAFNGAKKPITAFEADVRIVASGGELRQLRLNVGNDTVLEMTGHYDENLSWHTDVDVRMDAADVQTFWQTFWQPSWQSSGNPLGEHPPSLHGMGELHVTAEGTPERVSGTLTAKVPSLTVAGLSSHFTPTGGALHLRDVAIDAAFSTHPVPTFALNRLQMHIAEGIVQASATLTSDVYEGAWHAAGVQLASIPPMEPFRSWKGHVSTTGNFSGKGTDASKLRLDGALELTDASLNGVAIADSTLACILASPVGAVSNRAYGRSGELNIVGRLAGADVHLGGQLGEALRLHATAVRMDKLMDMFGGARLNGRGEMTAVISTTGTIVGTLDIPDATFMDIPIGVLAGGFRYEAGQVFVENGRLTKGESRVLIEGAVDIGGALPATFRVVAEPFQVADYRQLLFGTPDVDVSGRVTGELFCDGSLAQLDGRGTFAVTDGYAWGIRLDELTLPLAIEDYALTIPDFQISARGQRVVLNLAMAASGDFKMDIRSHVPVQLAELMHAADVPDFPIDANMDIIAIATLGHREGSKPLEPGARGPLPSNRPSAFEVDVDITLADITYQGNPLTDATLHGTLVEREKTSGEPDIFEFVGEAFDGKSHITGEISTATDSPYHFTVQSRAMPATPILRCLHPMLEALTGTADSSVDITGTLAALSPKAPKNVVIDNVTDGTTENEPFVRKIYPYDVDIVIETTALRYRDIPITNREPIRLQLLNDVWTFTDVALMIPAFLSNEKVVIVNDDDGSTEKHAIAPTTVIERLANDRKPIVELTGTFSAQGEEMQLKAASPGFALEPLSTVLGIPIDGTARYEMSLNGTVTAPELVLEVTVPALRMQTEFGALLLSTTGARVGYQDNAVQIEPSVLHINGDTVEVVGHFDLNEKVVIDNVNDGSTEKHAIAQTPLSERLANNKKLNVNLRARQLNLANYAQFIRSRLTPEMAALLMDKKIRILSGTLEVSVDVTGSLAEPSIAIQAGSGEPLCIGKFPQPIVLDALQASVALTRETVHLTEVQTNLSVGDATYQARGTATFPLTPNKTPQFALTASANQLQVADFVSVIRIANDEVVRNNGVSLRNPTSQQDSQDVQDGQDRRGLKVDIDNVDIGLRRGISSHKPISPNALRKDKKAENRKAEGAIHGTLSAEVEVIGTGMSPEQFAATCEVTALSVTAGSLYVSLPKTGTGRAALAVASRYGTLEGTLAFNIASPLLAGTVNAAIGGTHAAPDITVSGHGTLHHLKWRGTVDYRDEHIAVHRIELASREGKTLTLSGGIPFSVIREAFGQPYWLNNVSPRNPTSEKVDIDNVDIGLRRGISSHKPISPNALRKDKKAENRKYVEGDREMEVHLRGQELPLAFFPKVAAICSEYVGVVDIDIGIVGTPSAPQFSGEITCYAPRLRLKHFPELIRNATLHIKAGEAGLDVTAFGFEVGDGGKCTLGTASLELDGLMPKAFALAGLRVRQFPLGAFAKQVVPPGLLADVRGHVTATLAECRIPLDGFFSENDAWFEVATASGEIEDVHFAFSAYSSRSSDEPLSRYDFRNTEPVQLVIAEGRARLLQGFLMKDVSYLRGTKSPLFQIAGDFSEELNGGQLPRALLMRLQARAPMDTYTLTKQENLFHVETDSGDFWLWQRLREETASSASTPTSGGKRLLARETKGRMHIFAASPTLGIDREAAFTLKADFSRQLLAGTVPAALRGLLASKGLFLPETPRVTKVDSVWQVQDEETKRRFSVVREAFGSDVRDTDVILRNPTSTLSMSTFSVYEHSLQLSVDKDSYLEAAACDIVVRVKNFDISPLTRDWPAATRLQGTLSGSLHIGTRDGAPEITLRRKKPRTRRQLDGIHLNGVPLEINGRLRYRAGVWEMSKGRPLTLTLGPEENRLTSTLRIETAMATQGETSLSFWEQLFQVPGHLRTGTLTGVLNMQANALEILPVLVPAVSDARGEMALYAALTGTLDMPQVSGKVTFKNLALELAASGVSLTDAAGDCELSNSQLAITHSEGRLNGGDVSVTGGVFLWTSNERIWHPTEPVLALEAILSDATFAQPGQYQFNVTTARLGLDGQVSSPLLTGEIVLGGGEYRQQWDTVRAWFAGTSVTATEVLLDASPFRELQLDIGLNAPSFYLLSSVTGPTDIHIACAGTLTGFIHAPMFKGDVRILDGRLSLFTQQYRVVEGSHISNESTTAFDPGLDIRLKTVTPLRAVPLRDGTTADLDILIAYTGKLSNVDYTLRAEPLNASTTELPTQEELLGLLTQRVALPFGGVTFGFEPYSGHIRVEYLLPRQMSLQFERDGQEGYGVDFQFEGRF